MKTFKNTQAHYKDPTTGAFVPFNTLGDNGNNFATKDELKVVAEDVSYLKGDVPDYWQLHIEEREKDINTALMEAGFNKSAFLFYSDAHWNYNSKMSPVLLKHMYEHTGANKTFFAGDVVNNEADDYDTMSYLWEWRNMIRDLPNHHSAPGNHDDGNTTDKLFDQKHVYGYLLAPEETYDIVRGESGLYYYIDSPSEKTRYFFLDTAAWTIFYDAVQAQFLVDGLISTPEGWHIVSISHIWYDTDYTVSPPTVSTLSYGGTLVLDLFDAYNSRETGDISVNGTNISYNFSECKGTVEFVVGGHTHWDYDGQSTNGIPVILCETDSGHVRSGLGYELGTITESAVSAIIADYDAKKISVIRVGRGKSREVEINHIIPSTYTNQLPISTDADGNVYNGIGYKTDTRISVSSGSFEERTETGWGTSGFIPAKSGDVVRLYNCTFTSATTASVHRGGVFGANDDKTYNGKQIAVTDLFAEGTSWLSVIEEDNLVQFTIPSYFAPSYIRIVVQEFNENSIITVNEEIT